MSEIYTMTSRMLNQSKMLDVVSHNMANVNTTGYKRQDLSFKAVLDSSQQKAEYSNTFSTVASKNNDFSTGDFKITNNALDLAINGDGFFAVKRGEGTVYTKNGHFLVNTTGQLVTANGEEVLGTDKQPIDIPLGTKVNITPQGEVKSIDGALFGQVGLFKFDNKATLVQAGNSSFASPDEPAMMDINQYSIVRGALESSNVNPIQESVKLTEVSRAYQSAAKLVKTFEDLESKAIKDLYKVQ
jgi:flagellar basal-body rod protein FlgF|tara:strand:+ start:3855 stop:4583 length:729 start_codon:yes stop_codon:yes gene_type:complete